MQVPSLGPEDPLEEGMATHSSILVWRMPWTEGPGGLQSTVSLEQATFEIQLVPEVACIQSLACDQM